MTTTYKGFTLVTMKGFNPSAGLYTINHDTKEKYVIEKVPDGGYAAYRPAIFIQFPKQSDRLARSEYEGKTAEELFIRWVDGYQKMVADTADTPRRPIRPRWDDLKKALGSKG